MVRNGIQNKGNTVSLYVKNSCVFKWTFEKKWLSKKVVSYMFVKNQEMRVFFMLDTTWIYNSKILLICIYMLNNTL